MIYPENFEEKIGMTKIREIASGFCLYEPGREEIRKLSFSSDPGLVKGRLDEVREFTEIIHSGAEFPVQTFIDILPALKKARIEGRFLEVFELVNIKKVLESVRAILNFLNKDEREDCVALRRLAGDVKYFPLVYDRLDALLNKHGNLRDNASPELADIRSQIKKKEASVSRRLNQILSKARAEGIVDENVNLSIRNGRAVIPVLAGNKRKLDGYIHDESSTGQTVYIEPSAIVETNNELRELENLEKREIVKILTAVTSFIRPYVDELAGSHYFLARIDSIRARTRFAIDISAVYPVIKEHSETDWQQARHPLLYLTFRAAKKEKEIVPLDITLDSRHRILVISGPNAGGKSVCLQTLGLLQYMFQSGFLVPAASGSVFGIYNNILLDMGDEQSIEDDLSTYSSHLLNMKTFLKNADDRSLILIDEFGSGTEPSMGAAIAESVLENLNASATFGLITTHYTNLKHFASSTEGMVNGAMLFDTRHLKPLYKLSMGKPGSSFAFEIARKIGLPEQVLKVAEAKAGQENVDFDRHLKDIIRDKKYWENKRSRIRVNEKKLAELVEKYDVELSDTEKLRKKILKEAKEEAEKILAETNRRIENTIREIREAEAEKERTKSVRKELEEFRKDIKEEKPQDDLKDETLELQKKLQEVRRRNQQIQSRKQSTTPKHKSEARTSLQAGDHVLMKGQEMAGEIISIKHNKAEIAFGNIKTTVKTELLTRIPDDLYQNNYKPRPKKASFADWDVGKRKILFSPDIDVRGKRAEEALRTISNFIDEAVMVQARELRILHGKGNGILRELIRQELSAHTIVEWFGDEHVENGGAGITVVRLSP